MKLASNIQLKVKKISTKPNKGKLAVRDNLNKSQINHPLLGNYIHNQEEWEELEEGGQPPRKPNRDKNLPPDKVDDEEDQEEEDSDRTETVSDSTSGEGVKIVKKDGTELSLRQLLKLVNKTKK